MLTGARDKLADLLLGPAVAKLLTDLERTSLLDDGSLAIAQQSKSIIWMYTQAIIVDLL